MPRSIQIARYLCLLPGIFLVVSGTALLLFPNAAAAIFDVPAPQLLENPAFLAMGIRQVAIGLMIVVLAGANQIKALGLIMLIGAIVPLSDYFIFAPSIGQISALRHAGPVPVIFGLGLYLLLASRRQMVQNQERGESV